MAATTISGGSFDSLATSTLHHIHKAGVAVDVITNANPTWMHFKEKGRVNVDGGSPITIDLMYGHNTAVDSYSDLDVLDISRPDGITKAYQEWAQYHVPVTISGHEERVNKGKAKVFDLLKTRVKQSMASAAERLNKDLWYVTTGATTGNGGKNIISIPMLIPVTDYTGGSATEADIDIHGIDASANSWWEAREVDFTSGAITQQVFLRKLRQLYMECTKKGGQPDIAICDYTTYEMYMDAMDTKVRYTSIDNGDVGFKGATIMGCKLFPDVYVPDPDGGTQSVAAGGSAGDGAIYMINSNHMELKILDGADFKPGPFSSPENQDARVANYIFEGQMIIDKRDCHGVGFGIHNAWA